jgi:hypothetical protein
MATRTKRSPIWPTTLRLYMDPKRQSAHHYSSPQVVWQQFEGLAVSRGCRI